MHNIKIGSKEVKFVRSRGEVVYPDYIRDGLVLWYDFSGMENSGVKRGIAEDLSGNRNDGALTNFAFDEGSGYADNGLEFDGVDDYINKNTDSSEFDFDDITVTSVFKFNVEEQPHVSSLVNKGSYNTPENLALGFANGQRIVFAYGTSYRTLLHPYTDLNTQGKIMYTGIARGNTLELYINGILVRSVQVDRVSVVNNYNLIIGAASYTPRYVEGNIYSTRIYNRALAPEEIAHNYKIDKHRFNITE